MLPSTTRQATDEIELNLGDAGKATQFVLNLPHLISTVHPLDDESRRYRLTIFDPVSDTANCRCKIAAGQLAFCIRDLHVASDDIHADIVNSFKALKTAANLIGTTGAGLRQQRAVRT